MLLILWKMYPLQYATSRGQERREAKHQMYLFSTEKAATLGQKILRKDEAADKFCQKCYQPGHWTFECKNDRVYLSRPSRTKQVRPSFAD